LQPCNRIYYSNVH